VLESDRSARLVGCSIRIKGRADDRRQSSGRVLKQSSSTHQAPGSSTSQAGVRSSPLSKS